MKPWEVYKQEAGGKPWETYQKEAGDASAAPATDQAAPAKPKEQGFWSKVLKGTAKALNTRPEQVSGSLLDGGIKVREKTAEEQKLPQTMAAKRASNTLGVVQGAALDPLMAGAQFLPGQGGEKFADAQLQGYENFRKDLGNEGFDTSRLIGNVASPVSVKGANLVNKGLGMWGKAPGLVRQGATMGAVAGATQPVLNDPNAPIDPDTGLPERKDFWSEKGTQVGTGALLGGALNKVIGPGGNQFRNPGNLPATPAQLARQKAMGTDQVSQYRQMFPDADLTWGQALGPRANEWEQRLSSMPFVGDVIRGAREKALKSQNVSMMNKALEPAGIKLDKGTKAGREMFDDAYTKLSKQYDDVLDKSSLHDPVALRQKIQGTGKMDDAGNVDTGIIGDRYHSLSDDAQKRFDKIMENQFFQKFGKDPSGNHSVRMTGRQFKNHEEKLKDTIDSLKNGTGEERTMGKMLDDVLGTAYQSLQGETPEVANQLKKINKSYANFKTLESASTASAGSGGVFNPLQTIKAATKGSRGQVARGKGLLQPEAELSQDVLGRTVPDSGTAGRMMSSNPFTALAGGALSLPLEVLYSPKFTTIATQGGKKLGEKLEGTKLGAALAKNHSAITPGVARYFTSPQPEEKEDKDKEYRRGGQVSMRDSMYYYSPLNQMKDYDDDQLEDFFNSRGYAGGGLTQNDDGSVTINEGFTSANPVGPRNVGQWANSPARGAQQKMLMRAFEQKKDSMDPQLRGLIEKYMVDEPNPELAMARASDEFVMSRPNTFMPRAEQAISRALSNNMIDLRPASAKKLGYADGGEVVWSDIQGAEQPVQDPREVAYGQPLEDTSFVGAASKIFRPKLAKYAEKMEKAGKTPEEIWNKTMTARIPETGQWAQEIADDKFKMNGVFDKNWRHLDKGFKADQLFEAYPELKTQFYRNNPDMRGFASHSYTPVPGDRALEKHMFDLNLPKMTEKGKDPHSSMLHEIQHYIQAREGWPQGGSQETGARMAIQAGKGKPLLPPEAEKMLQSNIQEFQGLRDQVAGMPRFKGKTDHLRKLDKEINDRMGIIEDKKGKMGATAEDAYDFYRRLGGEAQSRLTERRMGLTAKERKQHYPFMERNEANPYGMDVNPKDLINKGYGEGYADGGWLGDLSAPQGPDLSQSFVNQAQPVSAPMDLGPGILPKGALKDAMADEGSSAKKANKKIKEARESFAESRGGLKGMDLGQQNRSRLGGGTIEEERIIREGRARKDATYRALSMNEAQALRHTLNDGRITTSYGYRNYNNDPLLYNLNPQGSVSNYRFVQGATPEQNRWQVSNASSFAQDPATGRWVVTPEGQRTDLAPKGSNLYSELTPEVAAVEELKEKIKRHIPEARSKLGWSADVPLFEDEKNSLRFKTTGNTGSGKSKMGMFEYSRRFAEGGAIKGTAQAARRGSNQEVMRQAREAITSLPSVAESLGRGAVATIPGTAGDVSDFARIFAPETMQNTFGERSLPTTEELLHKMPRLSQPTPGAENLEMAGGIIGGILPFSKAAKVGKLAKAKLATPRKRGGLMQVKK